MVYSIIIFSSAGNKDYSQTVTSAKFETNREGNPSKLTFSVLKTQEANFHEGDRIRFAVDNTPIFAGFVFTKVRDRYGEFTVTCYDQIRYLKAKGSYVFENYSAGDIIRDFANKYGLSVGDLIDTGYRIPTLIKENKQALDIVVEAVNLSSYNTNRRFVFFDNVGKLTLQDTAQQKQNVILGDRSLVYDFTYTTDIDTDTYNQIKLVRPNESTGRADTYIYYNSEGIRRWGLLEYYEQVDENLNEGQIDERAKIMLTYYNRVLRKLSIDCLGVLGLRAGQMVPIYMPEIGDISINHYLTIHTCTHYFEENIHTMSLELYTYLDNEGDLFIETGEGAIL